MCISIPTISILPISIPMSMPISIPISTPISTRNKRRRG